jgi:two-component system CheB/CheR fusion protein
VVGLAASAGGLDAFKRFFSAMPADSGMAFVLVQHLDPTHESLMVELLTKVTPMRVVQIADGMQIEPNCVFMIPPNRSLTISQGTLHLTEPVERRGMRVPIDVFFRSLAEDQQERAIGIILSGTGTEGSLGLKAIKASGGMTIAQAPETASYEGMPRSAISAGVVDHVMPVEAMPELLLDYVSHWYFANHARSQPVLEEPPVEYLESILALLRARLKYEFRIYKKATLLRRVQRRMVLKHIEHGHEYLELLRRNPDELHALFKDLLVSVTNFFRERESWQALEEKVIRPLVQEKKPDQVIRVWVPGCASGEEAYSIAMLLIEHLQETKRNGNIQIFATDIDDDALNVARAGIYPASIAADISQERLNRFFVNNGDSYTVNKLLRDSVMFAVQNVISDVPFSKLDLISCRNLLIYLEPPVQNKLVALFHFALREGRYLFLGSAETIGPNDDLFEPESKKWRIYRHKWPVKPTKVEFPIVPVKEPQREAFGGPGMGARPRAARFAEMAQKLVLEMFSPACVVVNAKYEILYFQGPTERYMTQPAGLPIQDVLTFVREGLRTPLRGALHRATTKDQPLTVARARIRRGDRSHMVKISITPIKTPKEAEGLYMIAFEDQGDAPVLIPAETQSADEDVVRSLEEDLRATKEDLQGSIEQLESANEELKTANEEVMSMNEELQSINEELETSKEELQSLNEELTTVNNQLEGKITELEATNDDLNNLLISTNIAAVFLDLKYRIRRFTPAVTKLFNLIQADVGRPLSDISPKFTDPGLASDAESVLRNLTPVEREVQTQDQRWFNRSVLPYRTEDNRIAGIVVTFADITEQKRAEQKLQRINEDLELHVKKRTAQLETANEQLRHENAERERAEHALRDREARTRAIVDTAADAIITMNEEGRIETLNRAAQSMFARTADEVFNQEINVLIPSLAVKGHSPESWSVRGDGAPEVQGVRRELAGRNPDGTTFPIDLVISEIELDHRRVYTIIARNISDRRRLEREVLEASAREQQRISRDLHDRVGQELTGLGYLATSLSQKLGPRPQGEVVTKIADGIQHVVGEVRSAIRGLTPVASDDHGLMTALEELAARTQERIGIPCRFVCPKPVSLEDNASATHLYMIAQEAVHNAVKHAKAKEITIHLEGRKGRISLDVSDDGIGLASIPEPSKSMGLHIMRYRAGEIGAIISIDGKDGAGTRVTCTFPKDDHHG